MNGGSITNNTSIKGNGAGVCVCDGTFYLNGGTISGNKVTDRYNPIGGGVAIGFMGDAQVPSSGTGGMFIKYDASNTSDIIITGNTSEMYGNNNLHGYNLQVRIRGELTSTSNIGISSANISDPFTFTSGWSEYAGNTPLSVFTSDDTSKNVVEMTLPGSTELNIE